MSSSTTVAAVVVGGPFVLTVAAIVIVPAMLARRSAAAAASSAISWASLLHVVPISVTSVLDYLSDVLVAAVMVNGEGEQLVLGRIALGFLGLSIVCAWVTLVGFWVTETRAAYGHDQRLKLHQLLLASLLAPLNLHVLYLGIVYSHTEDLAEGGGDGAPQTPGTPKTPGSPSTRALRSTNAGWYCMFVTLKLLETSLESVPLAILIVAIALEPPLISLYLDLLLVATAPHHLARSLNPKPQHEASTRSLNPKPKPGAEPALTGR